MMKIQKSILLTALIAGLSLWFIACSENNQKEKSTVETLENQDNQSKALIEVPTKTDLTVLAQTMRAFGQKLGPRRS